MLDAGRRFWVVPNPLTLSSSELLLDTYWILDTGCWILDARRWMLDAGRRFWVVPNPLTLSSSKLLPDTRYRMLVALSFQLSALTS